MNKEFQELKRQWGLNSKERAQIIDEMRKNLKSRNNGLSEYKFNYTFKDKVTNIDTCSNVPEDLFAIDGDMNPRGK